MFLVVRPYGNDQYDLESLFGGIIKRIHRPHSGPFYILIAIGIVFMVVLEESALISGICHSKLDSEGILKLGLVLKNCRFIFPSNACGGIQFSGEIMSDEIFIKVVAHNSLEMFSVFLPQTHAYLSQNSIDLAKK